MKEPALRYVTTRPGAKGTLRYMWQRPGWPLKRLPDDFLARAAEAKRLNDLADQRRMIGPPAPEGWPENSWGWLVDEYKKTQRWKGPKTDGAPQPAAPANDQPAIPEPRRKRQFLSKASKRAYAFWIGRMVKWFPMPIVNITRAAAWTWLSGIEDLSSQRQARAILSVLYEHAVNMGRLEANPIAGMRIEVPDARDRYVMPGEFERLLDAAAQLDSPPDWGPVALHLLLFTAQRKSDGLALAWPKDGRIKLRQEKTRKLMAMPVHRRLQAVLDTFPRRGVTILVASNGKPVTVNMVGPWFIKVREKAGLDDLQLRDFRRTAVVLMAEAGCTVPQIAAITGHSIKRTQQIIDTYFVATEPMALAGIERWEQYVPRTESNVSRLMAPENPN